MRQVKQLDFTGQSIYCGIDTHKRSWSVTSRMDDRELKTFTQNPDPWLLSRSLKSSYPNATIYIAYEAGFCGYWPQRVFESEGLHCSIVHPADVPTPEKSRQYKTDAVDCRKLALELSKGSLNSIYIPDQFIIEARSLVRTRQQLVKDQTRYKNRILSFLNFYGIDIPEGYKRSTHFSKRFICWLQELPLNEYTKAALKIKVTVLQSVRDQILEVTRHLRRLAGTKELKSMINILLTIPGIGLQSAVILATELADIRRFKTFDHLASYAGFKPSIYASGEKSYVRGISRQCNHMLRETLVEAAWMAIGKDPALTLAYYEYKKKMHYNKAIIRIAKKLLNRVRYVLLNDKPYVMGVVE